MENEQILINELIRLLCKGGGETFVGNFQKDINQDGKPEAWTSTEIQEAVQYMKYINEFFGKDEAVAIITSLITRYNINVNDLAIRPDLGTKQEATSGKR
jgi:hypothetical protein